MGHQSVILSKRIFPQRTYLLKGLNEVEKDEKLSQKEQKLIEVFRELKKVEQDMFLRQIIGLQMTMEQ